MLSPVIMLNNLRSSDLLLDRRLLQKKIAQVYNFNRTGFHVFSQKFVIDKHF